MCTVGFITIPRIFSFEHRVWRLENEDLEGNNIKNGGSGEGNRTPTSHLIDFRKPSGPPITKPAFDLDLRVSSPRMDLAANDLYYCSTSDAFARRFSDCICMKTHVVPLQDTAMPSIFTRGIICTPPQIRGHGGT